MRLSKGGERVQELQGCHGMRAGTSRGGRREAPAAGAAGPSPQPVCGSVSAAGEELAAARAAPCRGLRHSLSAAPRPLRGLRRAAIRESPLRAGFFRPGTGDPSCRRASLRGRTEGASLPFCLPLLCRRQRLRFCQRLGSLGTHRGCRRESPCAAASL